MSSLTQPRTRRPSGAPPESPRSRREVRFERIYRENVGPVTAYFARRTGSPQTAADLTADTFVVAIRSFSTFDPSRGTPRSWIFGIAQHLNAAHHRQNARDRDAAARLGGHRALDPDEVAELVGRIDAERVGRQLREALDRLSATDREVIDLVDLAGLAPKEAAAALGLSRPALRVRLFRARTKLRDLTTDTTTEA